MAETITVAEGESLNYDLYDGEKFENMLIDQRAQGAEFSIRARDKSGWAIRNVGFLGVAVSRHTTGDHAFQMRLSCPEGSEGVVENCYLYGKSDGPGESPPDGGTRHGGIYIRPSHAGTINISHTYIEGFGNNAVYGSAVGKDGAAAGTVMLENCFHRDNTVSQYRIGTPESEVRNCVGIVDDPEGLRGAYPNTSGQNARGVWGKHFDGPTVRDSAFVTTKEDVQADGVFEARYITDGRSNGDEAVLHVIDCDVNEDAPSITQTSGAKATVEVQNLNHNPSVEVIKDGGVPTSAEMAAEGGREYPSGDLLPDEMAGGGPDPDPDPDSSILTITNDGSAEGTYAVEVDGKITEEAGIGTADTITKENGTYVASGFVNGGTDSYRLHGPISHITVEGPIEMTLDGEPIDPGEYPDGSNNLEKRVSALETGVEKLEKHQDELKTTVSDIMSAREAFRDSLW